MSRQKYKKQWSLPSDVPLPSDFIREMRELLGEEADLLVEALQLPPVVSVRRNRAKTSALPPLGEMTPVSWCDSGAYLESRPDFTNDPLFHVGAYYVQEASSMVYEQLAASLLHVIKEDNGRVSPLVLDLCAAPGGKSTAVINAMKPGDILVANEFDRKRASVLKSNIERWGVPDVVVCNSSPSRLGKLSNLFDLVIVDAPCSGEGMMRREPMARAQWSERLVEDCAALQRSIVEDILPALKEGGFMVYSTCTFNRLENEDNVDFFIDNLPLEPWPLSLDGVGPSMHGLFKDDDADAKIKASFRFMPHVSKGEGLFVAVMRKKGQSPFASGSRKPMESQTLSDATLNDRIFKISPDVRRLCSQLLKEKINILSAGAPDSVLKGKLAVPDSMSVLSVVPALKERFPEVEISRETALSFLRGNPLSLPPETPRGFVMVSFQGHPLGLVKNLGSRANNLYPDPLRIKK